MTWYGHIESMELKTARKPYILSVLESIFECLSGVKNIFKKATDEQTKCQIISNVNRCIVANLHPDSTELLNPQTKKNMPK